MHKYSEQKHSENCEYTLTYLDLTLHTFNNNISEYILSITHPGSASINQNLSITHPGSVSINKKIEHNLFRTSEYKKNLSRTHSRSVSIF